MIQELLPIDHRDHLANFRRDPKVSAQAVGELLIALRSRTGALPQQLAVGLDMDWLRRYLDNHWTCVPPSEWPQWVMEVHGQGQLIHASLPKHGLEVRYSGGQKVLIDLDTGTVEVSGPQREIAGPAHVEARAQWKEAEIIRDEAVKRIVG